MSRKDSRVIHNILKANRIEGMNEDDIYRNSQTVLQLYKEMEWNTDINIVHKSLEDKCSWEDLAKNLESLQKHVDDVSRIKELYNSGALSKMIRYAVGKTQSFPKKGQEYFDCLHNTFLDPQDRTVEEIIDNLHISRGTYYDTRHEAIILVGAILWGSLIPFCIKHTQEAFMEVDHFLTICEQEIIGIDSHDDEDDDLEDSLQKERGGKNG